MPARIDDNIACLLNFGDRYMSHMLSSRLAERGFNITADQCLILKNLWMEEGVSQQQLACFTQKNKVSIVKLVDGLEKRQLVVRSDNATDRRAKSIMLTPQGRAIRQEVTEIVEDSLAAAVAGIGEAELKTCKEVIRAILENITRMNCQPVDHKKL